MPFMQPLLGIGPAEAARCQSEWGKWACWVDGMVNPVGSQAGSVRNDSNAGTEFDGFAEGVNGMEGGVRIKREEDMDDGVGL